MSNRAKPVVAISVNDPRRVKVSNSIRGMAREIGVTEETDRKTIGMECKTGGGNISPVVGETWYVEYF